jgi:hypothetical protein
MAIITTIARSLLEGSLRIEAEYYTPAYVEIAKRFRDLGSPPLAPYCRYIRKGIFDLPPTNYASVGVPFIRTTEIKSTIADLLQLRGFQSPYIVNTLRRNSVPVT